MTTPSTTEIQRIRTLVAEDYPHMQAALVSCLEGIAGVEVVATALDGSVALQKAQESRLGLAVIDLQMPIMDGFKVLRALRSSDSAIRLVAISGHQSPTIQAEAILAGADLFVAKNELPFGLISAVEKLLAR